MGPKRSASRRSPEWAERLARLRGAQLAVVVGFAIVMLLLYVNLASSERKIEHPIPHLYATGDSQFVRTLGNLLGPAFVPGNRVAALLNGDQAFPAMLSERARAGVRTHLLLDWAGSQKVDRADLERMRKAGVEVVLYRPPRWYQLGRLNRRTHRKLLVVDGRTGFTGGMGVGDQWLGHAQDRDHWRDSQFRAEGPVVAQLQAAFMDDWFEAEGAVLDGPGYFPDLDPVGPELAQVFRSSPQEGNGNLRLMFLLAIASASRRILIANSYFVPDRMTVDMLVAARRRGVEVEIIVPGPILDAQMVRRASRAKWGPLLEAGVRIYEYQPTMYHGKEMVVDDVWVSVGSTNYDDRSFRLKFGADQARVFAEDRGHSRRITLEEWRRRPIWERIQERFAGVMQKQL